jgi:hypothetical protein
MSGQLPLGEAGMKKIGLIVTPDGVQKVFPMAETPVGTKAGIALWESLVEEIERFDESIRRRMAGSDGVHTTEGVPTATRVS